MALVLLTFHMSYVTIITHLGDTFSLSLFKLRVIAI